MTKDSSFDVPKMTEKIDVKKDINREFATFCVKTHKYDEFPNKSSMWTPNERMEIMKHVAKQALKEIILYHNSDDKLCSTTYDNIHR